MVPDTAGLPAGRIERHDPAALGAEPHFAGGHLHHGENALLVHGWRGPAFQHRDGLAAAWRDDEHAGARADPHPSGCVVQQGGHGGRLALGGKTNRQRGRRAGPEAQQAPARAYPQGAGRVAPKFLDGAFKRARLAGEELVGEAREFAALRQVVQAAGGADPQTARAVIGQAGDVAAA